MITASHHMCKPIALLFGSCEDVDDDTDNETNDTKAWKHHPAYVLLVIQEVLLPFPLCLSIFYLSFLPFFLSLLHYRFYEALWHRLWAFFVA